MYDDSKVDWKFFEDRRSNWAPLQVDVDKLKSIKSDEEKIGYLKGLVKSTEKVDEFEGGDDSLREGGDSDLQFPG